MVIKTHKIFTTSQKRSIAYVRRYHSQPRSEVGVMFLAGFRSDMNGTKASFLEEWCLKSKYNFLKFDYSGHGQSSGSFESGCITDWCDDACAVLDELTEGPQILVGSSMGGWISLLLGRRRSARIVAFVGIASAPDFTENSMWANLDKSGRKELDSKGRIELASDYSDQPYVITKKLIEDGRSNLIMNRRLDAPYSVRLLQGMLDADVSFKTAIALSEHIEHGDVEVVLLKNADHQFSSPRCLDKIKSAIKEFL